MHIVAKTEDDKQAVRSSVEKLLAGRWSLTANGQAIERSFKFKNFTKTWVHEGPPLTLLECGQEPRLTLTRNRTL